MSRPDLNFTAAGDVAPDAAELITALEQQLASGKPDRREAIARFLANAPDWREARDCLDGAFAAETADSRLTGRKAP